MHTFLESECAHPDRMCAMYGECMRVHQLCDGILDCPDGKHLIRFNFECDMK